MRRVAARVVVLAALCGLAMVLPALPATAHPLGNFSVNHYNGLSVYQDRVDLKAIVDTAEIPTLQERPSFDGDGDGRLSDVEREAAVQRQCAELVGSLSSTVDGESLRWSVRAALVEYPQGQADLPTTRLTCELAAPVRIQGPVALRFTDTFRAERVGWHEITAVGVGVALSGSAVPSLSVTDELRRYPDDLLSTPMDVRSVQLRVRPGVGSDALAGAATPGGPAGAEGFVGSISASFVEFVGSPELTPLLGVLAILLSLILGASHAALPGHGKTVIAAYLVGRRGTARDAVLVGATVTLTHTAGVLVLGLLLSVSSVVAGESVLRWLGAASGLLIAGIGAALLRSAARRRTATSPAKVSLPERVLVGAGHGHGHGHSGRFGRAGLLGMGVAGGLVPSPSALIVLLGAIALGRTWFGVLLVLGYGAGMAVMLTAAGLLLVKVRDRLDRSATNGRLSRYVQRWAVLTPVLTAAMVLVVGMGLTVRALAGAA